MRRAQLFDISMVFVVIGAMVGIWLVVTNVATEMSSWKSISHRAFELQNAYMEGDYFVSFLSMGLRWTAGKAVVQLGQNGGFAENPLSGCGKLHKGYALWNSKDQPQEFCYPNVYDALYAILKQQLPSFNSLYAQKLAEKKRGIERINVQAKPFTVPYEFLVTGNRLLAVATAPVFIHVLTPPEQFKYHAPADCCGIWTTTYKHAPYVTGMYVFRPNLEVQFDYNLGIYNVLAKTAQTIVNQCAAKNSTQAKECVKAELIGQQGVLNERLTITIENDEQKQDLFLISIIQDDKGSIYSDNMPPVIRFGLYLVAPPAQETLSSEQ